MFNCLFGLYLYEVCIPSRQPYYHVLPNILPLLSPMVYLHFVAHSPTVEQGFQIIYREHLSPNSASTQLSPPSNTELRIPLIPSVNTTSFSKVFHHLDSLIAGNLLTANQLEYAQSQLNDRLEEFSYQLGTHVQKIANTACTTGNHSLTAYTSPFPYYEHVMLSLSAISILFSVFFVFLTCCLSWRLYHLYLISDNDRLKTSTQGTPIYQPGKYARTIQHLIMLTLILPVCAKPLPPDNLLLELWNHAQWEDDHGIFLPFLPYRPSESFFQYMIFVFIISIFSMVFYILLSLKSGGRSRSSNSSMTNPKPLTLRKQLSQISLITLLSCGSNTKASLAPITEGTFVSPSTPIPEKMHYTPNTTWKHISFDHLWERPQEDYAWKNPIPMYSKTFGYAVAEGKTFTQKYYPRSRYWEDIDAMERTCLCAREVRDIFPPLNKKALTISTPITRQTGHLARHRWKIQMNRQPNIFVNWLWDFTLPEERTFALLAIYKQRVISLLDKYAVVQVNCKMDTEQATCGIYNYDCLGDITYDPNEDEPLLNVNQITITGTFWQQYWELYPNC